MCYLADPIEALVAEPVFSLLANTNIDTGGGFNITQGGVQTTSSRLPGLTKERRKEVWEECQAWRLTHTDYNVNHAEELHRLHDPEHEKYVKACFAKQMELNRQQERKKQEERDALAAKNQRIRQENIQFLQKKIKTCEVLMRPGGHISQGLKERVATKYGGQMEKLKARLAEEEAKH